MELASQKRLRILILLLAGSLVIAGFTPQVHAAGYNLTIVPVRTQESNTPGVILSLNVTAATSGTMYQFTWTVTDSSGAAHNASNSTTAPPSGTFVLTVAYPSKFGTNINFVGNYTVNVAQNNPTNIPSVQTGHFQVGLTDSVAYERTFTASIKARGYPNNSPVTIGISHSGTSAPGYPASVMTDPTGILSTTWKIPANVPTGIWTVSLSGGPAKPVPDNQNLTVSPANVTIPSLNLGRASLMRTQTQTLRFTANYPNGSSILIGSTQIRVTESNGATSFFPQASYNSSLGAFYATYKVPAGALTGVWTATLAVDAFDDGYGNLGPTTSVTSSFTVSPANITISQLNIGRASLLKTQSQSITFTATYPTGVSVQTGSAQIRIIETDGTTSIPTSATYNSSIAMFQANYRIQPSDQTGAWVASIDPNSFNDGFGNTGPSTSVVRAFTVQVTTLSVSATIPTQTYTVGQVIPVYVTITYPDGSPLTTGNVTATLSSSTVQIGTMALTFVQGQSQWVGAYTVKSNDTSGVWLVNVKVSDAYQNTSQETISAIVSVPPPVPAQQPLNLYYFILTALAIGSGGSGLVLLRRINPTHGGFDEFFKLTGGELSPSTTLLVLGEPGSGTSTLSQELIHSQLRQGRPCGLLTCDAFPSEVVRAMRSFGWDESDNISKGTFKILDCYSALAGVENAPIRDPVDFTEISIQVSSMIEKSASRPLTLVVDSINPIFNSAQARTAINFLRVLSAKIKNNNGILVLAGAKGSIPEDVRSNLETIADGMIEIGSTRSGQSIVRTLSVKRLVGRKISPKPAEFDIVPGKGILFRKLRIPLGIISPKQKTGS